MNKLIGERIKQRRKELNITQKQIEKETGISSGNLSGIETGRYLPSSTALIDLSNILDCSIDWILKGESLNSNIPSRVNNESNYRKAQLLTYYDEMSIEDQQELLMIAKIKYEKEKAISSSSDPDIETA